MNLLLLLEMAAAGRKDATAVEAGADRLTPEELLGCAWAAVGELAGAKTLAFVGTNGVAFPVALFAAAAAGVPFAPLNYRLADEQIAQLLARLDEPLVVCDTAMADRLRPQGHRVVTETELLDRARAGAATGVVGEVSDDGEQPAVLLFTSGTTAQPKAAVLRHRHLASYVVGTVEFGGASDDEAVLVSVPPYHVAGLANLLSNLSAGRRIVYMRQCDADVWVEMVRAHSITHAMVVPTMLARIAEILDADGAAMPSLRSLSYGGAKMPANVLQHILQLLPDVAFTNAYGLTETSSTISVLTPEDHRAARGGDPKAIDRLTSAGKVLPTIEVEVRDEVGPLPPGTVGEIWVRGEQVSGEYAGLGSQLDGEGWFPTRDRGRLDDDGYLYIEGRADDTIIRGGENIAPAEIEEVLLQHPAIAECAVVGVPDDEWGHRIAAVIVCHEGAQLDKADVQRHVRASLRGSKTPDDVVFSDALPYTETGKLLRRQVRAELAAGSA